MVMESILSILVTNGLQVVAAIISVIVASVIIPWIKVDMVPWLKEKRLYRIVSIGVNAAEKLAESMDMSGLDKKQYVINYLRSKNIMITSEVEAFIESAVHDLDLVTSTAKEQFNNGSTVVTDSFIEETDCTDTNPVG